MQERQSTQQDSQRRATKSSQRRARQSEPAAGQSDRTARKSFRITRQSRASNETVIARRKIVRVCIKKVKSAQLESRDTEQDGQSAQQDIQRTRQVSRQTSFQGPLSSALGTYKTVKARFWPWPSTKKQLSFPHRSKNGQDCISVLDRRVERAHHDLGVVNRAKQVWDGVKGAQQDLDVVKRVKQVWDGVKGAQQDLDIVKRAEQDWDLVKRAQQESRITEEDSQNAHEHIDRLRVGWLRGRDTRQVDVEGSPTQSRISPSIQRILGSKVFPEARDLISVLVRRVVTQVIQVIHHPDVRVFLRKHLSFWG